MTRPGSEGLAPGALTSLFAIPERRMVGLRPDIVGPLAVVQPVEVVRPEDLVHLTFSFVNLRLAGRPEGPPLLRRRATNRSAFLVVDFHSQHITERALFELATGYAVKDPPPPLGLPDGTSPPQDPDKGKIASEPDPPPAPPLFASLSGSSRLVLRVTSQTIPYTVEGLIAAITRLDLSVAPHALPPARRRRPTLAELFLSEAIDLTPLLAAASAPIRSAARRRRRVEASPGPTRAAAELAALGRMRAAAAHLEQRFGAEAALTALVSTRIGGRLGVDRIIGELVARPPIDVLPPLPAPPGDTQTALELPWRLLISPNLHGAFAHSPIPVEHEGRFELWHTRLGVRARDRDGKPVLDEQGNPTVDERSPDLRTIRAIWTRDFDILPAALGRPQLGFTSPPAGSNFPQADGSEDRPRERMSLNSRDRMMLVHETSNFHLKRNQTQTWPPEAVPTNRLMLTALGGWLDGRVQFPTLPDGGLTIEEWKHRAALARDHEVKVVYSGFLLPFGHRASLVKVTERKLAQGTGGVAAYLFQRMFIIVREPERRFRTDTRALPDGRRLDLSMPFATVRILTRVTPSLDPPQSLPAVASGLLFQPQVLGAPFLFEILAVDLEHNIVEFSAPLTFMERDHNDPAGNQLAAALNAYNTHGLVDRELDLRGQRVAYADSEQPDDTILRTHSMTFEVATAPFLGPPAVPQDQPRFAPALREARAVVPAMSALAGAATPVRLGYPAHYAAQGFAGNAAQVFLAALDKPPMSFAGQGDRSGGLITPSLNVKGLSRITGPIGGDLDKAIGDPGAFSVGEVFEGISAKLFGLIPLTDLFSALGFTPDRVPTFVTQALDIATTLKQNVERIRNAAEQHAAQLGAAASNLKNDVDVLLADLALLAGDPANPPALDADLQAIAVDLDPYIAAVTALPACLRRRSRSSPASPTESRTSSRTPPPS